MTEYQPGVCNIGAVERRRRRVAGVGSFAVAVALVLAVVLDVLPATAVWGAIAFVFGGWIGILQDYFRFCAAFGALARYDLTGSGGTTGSVAEAEAVRADRRTAIKIVLLSAVATAVTAVPLLLVGGAL
ncbi:hypothetical protein ACFQL1_13285 [Halomicroarcula sp. GCM10025709]|uniref:hypothetical protein n=1 Tax=Haloarcula TaxID=2237 RepID=UPI0024C43EA2|nr:hypothetical protein [Halomicroarcula sp. YJ-61-S]